MVGTPLSLHTCELTFPLGIYATSRHIPGVRFAGVTHPGLIGTAPSAELLATWNEREGALIAAHATSVPPVAFAPNPVGAHVGQDLDSKLREKIGLEGARTIPGREHGGNCDVGSFDLVDSIGTQFASGNRSRIYPSTCHSECFSILQQKFTCSCSGAQDVTFQSSSKAPTYLLETCISLKAT